MGRHKANGRHIMFSCRLSEAEYEDLQSFLAVAEYSDEDKSEQFRSLLFELNGRLKRNMLGHLEYVVPEHERISQVKPKKKEIEFPDLSKMKVTW